jgi:hypothetical protein
MNAEWSLLVTSWQLSLEAAGHALNTRMTYRKAVETLAG